MSMKKGSNLEDKITMRKLFKIKAGDRLLFKVLDVTDEFCISELVDLPLIKGKVIHANIGSFGINGSEWFEVGDVFEGKVLSKDINRTLIIVPSLNLAEMKKKKVEEDALERWKNGSKR